MEKMIIFKSQLTEKEKTKVGILINEVIDLYGDFYLTKNNIRLFIKENISVLFDNLKKGDKIAYCDDGVAIVTGFSDKFGRHYIKLLTKSNNIVDHLLKILFWNLNCDLYCKIKKNNPVKRILKRNGFKFAGGRGKEILFIRKYVIRHKENKNGNANRSKN